MNIKKIILLTLLTLSSSLSYSLDISEFTSIPKPNFFPKKQNLNNLDSNNSIKNSSIYLKNLIIDEDKMKKIGVDKKQIDIYSSYYLNKSKEFFSTNETKGFFILLIDVSSNNKNNDKSNCSSNPTECSITKMEYIFSDNISENLKNKFYEYIVNSSKNDNIEIYIKNYSYTESLKFGFQIYLNTEINKDNNGEKIIQDFIKNDTNLNKEETKYQNSDILYNKSI